MCFGPTPSFVAGSCLTVLGIATTRAVRAPAELLLATFPFFFALQQFDEGLLWIALSEGAATETIHGLSWNFLFIAFCIWPVCVPLSMYLLETEATNKRRMRSIVLIGAIVAVYCLTLLIQGSASADISRLCIRYRGTVPGPYNTIGAPYLISIFGAFFLSSRKELMVIGAVNAVLFGLASYLHHSALVSVWCFYAAIWSVFIWGFLRSLHSDQKANSWRSLIRWNDDGRMNDMSRG